MSEYENDPRVTKVSDTEFHIQINVDREPWRIYTEGGRWFSQSPPNTNPLLPDYYTFEHPSKETAFESIVGTRSTVLRPDGDTVRF